LAFEFIPQHWGGFEYLHRSPMCCRKRRKENAVPWSITGQLFSWGWPVLPGWLSFEFKTKNVEWLLYRRAAAILNDKHDLSTERASNINKSDTVWQVRSWTPDGCLARRETRQLTVSLNITLTLACEFSSSRELSAEGNTSWSQQPEYEVVLRWLPACEDMNPEVRPSLEATTKQRTEKSSLCVVT
jgi:hypothetical protein